ncbi:MAG: hypothetical protein N4A46_01335 [Schleiferiaceae bacterium]|jgi:hypothetical protein|nr:hypothetical protein [Schleiferiaceae bacterium]
MKNFFKITAALAFVLCSMQAISQNNRLNSSRSIVLKPNMTEQKVEVEVVGKVEKLKIEASCSIYQGEITVEIFGPDGSPQGKFKAGSLGANNDLLSDEEKEKAREHGRLEKYVDNPANGIWIVKVTPKKTSGNLRISSRQTYSD